MVLVSELTPTMTTSADDTNMPQTRQPRGLHEPPEVGVGEAMLALIHELFPICRSITGEGVRQTLRRLQQLIPLEMHSLPSGTPVLDWTIPPEWNVRDAYLANDRGERVLDFRRNNLHLVNYSVPVDRRVEWSELQPRLHSLPAHPDWIPYRTSYYRPEWGFCLSDRQRQQLPPATYHVRIDTTLEPGVLNWGEAYFPGETDAEYVFSTHVCHPSLANDNLAGIAVAAFLAQQVASRPQRRFGYRFLLVPGTIGAIAWLATREARWGKVRGGLVLALLGHDYPFTYKQSSCGDREVDVALPHVLRQRNVAFEVMPFEPYGYDERQYESPGVRLGMGCLMRSRYAGYPEYHTSADNLERLHPVRLAEALAVCGDLVDVWEANRTYQNCQPRGEPQLGRRGLYQSLGGHSDAQGIERAMLWLLHATDGSQSLLQVAVRSGLPIAQLQRAADLLCQHDLLREISGSAAK